jgi:hypothetical protein
MKRKREKATVATPPITKKRRRRHMAKATASSKDISMAAQFSESLVQLGQEIYRVEYKRALDSVIGDLKRARARIR